MSESPARMLLVMSEAGVFRHPLGAARRILVGRGEDCDVRLEDSKASRRHLEIELADEIRVIDLGSSNGTLVAGRRLPAREPAVLKLGEPVSVGRTVLMVQAPSLAERPLPLLSEAEFARRLDKARDEAKTKGAEFALAHVRFQKLRSTQDATAHTSVKGGDVMVATRLETGLRDALRPDDVLAYVGPAEYRVLIPGVTADEAEQIGWHLRETLDAHKVPADVGVAAFPRDGRSTEELADRAFAALRGLGGETTPRAQLDRSALDRLAPLIERVASGNINVLVLGETGVGKEVVARTVHARSKRAKRPMVCINCAALSETLLESELFGHERGSFTGAIQAKPGLLESADGGTVFLDEVGEMPAATQAKLLRVLEAREVMRIGALAPRKIDVRFIAATNRDLEAEVNEGRFRGDLYFRLDGITVRIPPLRERADEIAGLARAFAVQASRAEGTPNPPPLSEPVLAVLQAYRWPGNIRELKNVIERAVLLSGGRAITVEHLPLDRMTKPLATPEGSPRLARRTARRDEGEREKILDALRRCGGNQTEAAKVLGVSRRTLVSRIAEYGLPRPRRPDDERE